MEQLEAKRMTLMKDTAEEWRVISQEREKIAREEELAVDLERFDLFDLRTLKK
ncbi:MAG: hypothetical protein M1813_002176 [Trichoglossum hirsutum]|jgi:hypothetical protein|nr:MAG: hypothetical protein M1813_002176 [Trichoglossum hirsutum]